MVSTLKRKCSLQAVANKSDPNLWRAICKLWVFLHLVPQLRPDRALWRRGEGGREEGGQRCIAQHSVGTPWWLDWIHLPRLSWLAHRTGTDSTVWSRISPVVTQKCHLSCFRPALFVQTCKARLHTLSLSHSHTHTQGWVKACGHNRHARLVSSREL